MGRQFPDAFIPSGSFFAQGFGGSGYILSTFRLWVALWVWSQCPLVR